MYFGIFIENKFNMLFIILIGFMVLGFIVQARLKSKFKKYGKVGLQNGLSGREIAERMLSDHGINDVRVISTPGRLTDHYNPGDKTVNLSESVYNERSVAAAAVAAHEVGHAVQHATAYQWLQLRSKLVPVVSFSGKAINIIFMLMIFGGFVVSIFPQDFVLLVMIVLQGAIAAFTLVTLPVEYDASNRALLWLNSKGYTSTNEQAMAKDALNAAANTYLVAALAALTQLAYYVLRFVGND
jgi:Zn-dependent membrane protease YugP